MMGLCATTLSAAWGASATPIYEPKLMRLAEVLGSLQFLRTLCGDTASSWRDQMDALLASENPEPERWSRLMARYDAGYKSFQASYTRCTPSANASIDRYLKEGEALTHEITERYGN